MCECAGLCLCLIGGAISYYYGCGSKYQNKTIETSCNFTEKK
jgi:hypothetical protein